MKMTTLILLTFLMASPAFSADAAKGETTARKWCTECHDIAGATTSDKLPRWRPIANEPHARPKHCPIS